MSIFDRIRDAVGLGSTGESLRKPRSAEEFAIHQAQNVLDGYDFQWQPGYRLTIVDRSSREAYTAQGFLNKLQEREASYQERADRAPKHEKLMFQMNVDLTKRVIDLTMAKIARERKDHP